MADQKYIISLKYMLLWYLKQIYEKDYIFTASHKLNIFL